jgi:hypothetical protein
MKNIDGALKFSKKDIRKGVEISIEGCIGDPTEKPPGTCIYIEHYEGKVQCHVWNGLNKDCQTIILH